MVFLNFALTSKKLSYNTQNLLYMMFFLFTQHITNDRFIIIIMKFITKATPTVSVNNRLNTCINEVQVDREVLQLDDALRKTSAMLAESSR